MTQDHKAAQWKMVPVEPTMTMMSNARMEANRHNHGDVMFASIYKAMLNAAPSAPAPPASAEPLCSPDVKIELQRDSQRASEGAPAWQPIASAPKTGRTLLLGYFNSHGKWRTLRGKWMSDDYIAAFWEDPDDVEAGWYETVVEGDDIPNCWRTEPTHWQPLPIALSATPSPASEQDAKDGAILAEWMACESRRPWILNSLRHRAEELRAAEKRCRNAYKKDFMGKPAAYFADALAEAAAAFESRLAAMTAAQGGSKGE